MFIFIVFYHRYHLAAQKRNTLLYKIYIFVRCACSGYGFTKELGLYFADGNIVHYLSIFPLQSFILSRANNSFSFCLCDFVAILGRLFIPGSIYKKMHDSHHKSICSLRNSHVSYSFVVLS